MKRATTHLRTGWSHFWRQVGKVIRNPIFLALTVIGNVSWLVASVLFFIVEAGKNPQVHSWFDAMWWAIITMTTVGYGDITPHTMAGRFVCIGLILTGGVLFLSFIALLSSAFVELEVIELERRVREIQRTLDAQVKKQD